LRETLHGRRERARHSGGRRHRPFAKGQFKYLALGLLAERPHHGYELIHEVGERLGGRYAPSPGIVYPTLQMLEDEGCVSTSQQDGRRVYGLTELGQQYVTAQRAMIDDAWASAMEWARPEPGDELRDLAHRLTDLARLLGGRGHRESVPPEKATRIREVVTGALRDVYAILGE
jgi:DNA-binding PadR family transcriptional regulator